MIKYALACADGHEFESWFPDSAAYETQVRRGFVACPVCGSVRVGKAIMAPAIAGRRERAPEEAAPALPVPVPDPQALLRARLREMRRHIEANTENVGPRFPEQARQMHEGDIEHRPIMGQASPEEARALIEDGIAIMPVPVFPDDRH